MRHTIEKRLTSCSIQHLLKKTIKSISSIITHSKLPNAMRQRLLFIWLALLLGVSGIRAVEAYTYYDPSDGSLNFCYDNNRTSRKNQGYTTYNLNTGSNNPDWYGIHESVKELYFYSSFANYRPTTCYGWALDMTNLTKVSYIANLNTSSVTNMGLMFRDCNKLTSLDVSGFNTSNVTNMSAMFELCTSLTTLAVDNWNTSKVQNFSGVFYGCSKLSSVNVKNWDTKSATTMRYMFYKCNSLTSLDVSNWNTTRVTSYYYMFGYCYKLNTISGLTSAILGTQNFVMTSNVTTVEGMFYNCYSLYQLWLMNFEFGSSTTTTKMLAGCSGLGHLQISDAMADNLNSEACSGVGSSSSPCSLTYSNTKHLSFSTITPDYVVWKGGYFKSQNMHAYALVDGSTLTFKYDDWWTSAGASTIWNLKTGEEAPGWHTYASNITKVVFSSSFQNARPTSCYEWFDSMSNLTSITGMSSYLNTSKVTNMKYMFWHCSSLTSVDVSGFNTSNVTTFGSMFSGCSNLTTITGYTNFNTSNVTDMSYMFYNCSKLSSLDISKFDLSKLTSSGEMMSGCSALKTLSIPSTASKLASDACTGIGSTSSPCTLVYPSGFTPEKQATGSGWYQWKSGYFKDEVPEPYALFYGSTLTFYYDKNKSSRFGAKYSLNTGSNNPEWRGKAYDITKVEFDSSFANARPTSCFRWFCDMNDLTTIQGITYLNTSSVTNMQEMFYDCAKLASLDVSKFSTSNVTDMSGMFYGCSILTSLNVSGFNTAKVTDMNGMFAECYNLTNIDVSKFSTANVTDMSGMFCNCSKLTSINVSGFNTAKVMFMHAMFSGCSGLTSLNVSNFNTTNVITMGDKPATDFYGSGMFQDCSNLTSLNITNFNTAKVTDMSLMFSGCSKLTSIDLSNFNTSNVKWFYNMFKGCTKLTSLDISNFVFPDSIEFNGLTPCCDILVNCTGLKTLTIPVSAKKFDYDVCKGIGTKSAPCTLIYPSGFTPEKQASGSGWYMWKSGYFTDAPAEAYAWLSSDGKKLTFCHDKQKASRAGTTYALNTGSNSPGWYDKCAGVTSVVFNSAFADATPTSCYRWFYGMTSLTGITGLQYLNTEEVTNMASMFNNCSSLTSIDLSKFNTSNVTSMNSMFYKCSELTTLDLGSFDTESVKSMKNMFTGCSKLTEAKLYSEADFVWNFGGPAIPVCETDFVTTNVTDMTSMFENCSSLGMFLFPGLTLESTTATANMCKGCTAMEVVFVTTETLNNLDATAFDGVGGTTSCRLEMEDEFTPDITSRVMPYDDPDKNGYVMWKGGKFVDFLDAYAVYMKGELTFYYDRELKRWKGTGETPEGPFPEKVNITNESPGWLDYATTVTKVVFDSSFKNYKPNTTYRWFYGMTKLTSITGMKSNLNTTKVTSLASMFNNCASLKSIDVSNFKTSSVTSLNYMFYKCSKLSSLDISGFTLKSSQTSKSMMQNCTGLKKLTIPSTANYLDASACSGVGTKASPCELLYPSGFIPEKEATGSGWYQWKGGYFSSASDGILGDANGDGEVTVNDVQMVVEYVLGKNPSGIVLANCDVTGDNEVSINDVNAIVSMVLNGPAAIAPNARESLTDMVALTARGSHCSLHLDNSEPYHAFQLEVVLPEGGSMGNVTLAEGRSNGHHAEWSEVIPGRYNVIVYATNGEALRDGSTTALMHFDIAGCKADDVSVEGIQMIDGWCRTVSLPSTSGIATGIAWVVDDASDSSNSPYYNTVGVGSNTPQRGVNIKDGRKVVKK